MRRYLNNDLGKLRPLAASVACLSMILALGACGGGSGRSPETPGGAQLADPADPVVGIPEESQNSGDSGNSPTPPPSDVQSSDDSRQPPDVPPLTTDIPPLTTDVPPLTTDVPPLTTDVPPLTTDVPPLTTDVPPLTRDVPSQALVPSQTLPAVTDDGTTGAKLQEVLDTRETLWGAATKVADRPWRLNNTEVYGRNGSKAHDHLNCQISNRCVSSAGFSVDLDNPYFSGSGSPGAYDQETTAAPFYFWADGQQPLSQAASDNWLTWGAWGGSASNADYMFYVHGNNTHTYAVAFGEYPTRSNTVPSTAIANATWSGAMVGRDTRSGAYLKGDATMKVTTPPILGLNGQHGRLNLSFTNIRDAVDDTVRDDVPGNFDFNGLHMEKWSETDPVDPNYDSDIWYFRDYSIVTATVEGVFSDTTSPSTDQNDLDVATGTFMKDHSVGGGSSKIVGAFGMTKD